MCNRIVQAITRLVMCVCIGWSAADAVGDEKPVRIKNHDARIQAYRPGGASGLPTPRGPGAIAAGFEPGEGFFPGFVAGQVGWGTFVGGSSAEPHIDTLNPNAGVQHLRFSFDSAFGAGNQTGAFSPDRGPLPAGASTTSIMVAITNDLGADYDVLGQSPSEGLISWQVKFSYDDGGAVQGIAPGNILILDDLGGVAAFVDTDVVWQQGPYVELRVEFDPNTNSIDYSYGGVNIYTSVGGVFAGTRVEQIVILSDNFHLAGEQADFDDLLLLPPGGNVPGACCNLDTGICNQVQNLGQCGDPVLQVYTANGTCGPVPCAVAMGSCCDELNTCVFPIDIGNCVAFGGRFALNGTCAAGEFDPPCEAFGACCLQDCPFGCVETFLSDCAAANGQHLGQGTACGPGACFPPAADCCKGDFNGDTTRTGSDIQTFVTNLVENTLICVDPPQPGFCETDINNDGVLSDADIGPFVDALLNAPDCPFQGNNDNCFEPAPIFDGDTPIDTTLATTDPAIAAHLQCEYDGQTYNDIWFAYEATCTGIITVSTCGTVDYDSDLVVYDGLDCNNLANSILGCNDDGQGCPGFSSEVVVPVVSGSSYLIRVGGWMEGDVGTGTVNITCGLAPFGACCTNNATVCSVTTDQFACANLGGAWTPNVTCPVFSCANATVNDECISAEAITCGGSDSFELSSITSNVDDPTSTCEIAVGGPFAHDASVWYEFTAMETSATISLCGPTDDSVMTLFTDTSDCVNFPANLVERDCNDDFCTAPAFGPPEIAATGLTPGLTYLILIDFYSGGHGAGPFTLNITCP